MNLVWLIPGLPLAGFLIFAFFGKAIIQALGPAAGKKTVGGLATALVFASLIISILALQELLGLGPDAKRQIVSLLPGGHILPWIHIGNFNVNYAALVDPLSLLMCLIVTGVGGLIHLYATGYMADDKDYSRFFTYFNLFIFFMLTLVLSENILLMFVGWEGVGLCSYLLIAFWYEDTENSKAGNKAFIVNRIGDMGFSVGVMTIFALFGTLSFYTPHGHGFLDMANQGIAAHGALTVAGATLIGLLLFVGACGKSAQFPLYVWLPDAMAGPTPVSALIHAATMVTAGVVMISRVSPLIVHSPIVMTVIACTGTFTAIFAASIALTQNDIKKVLAYSTVSQLGYMFLACGVGAFTAGMFHVTTHAFFKALLFLGAGSVIHSLSGEQDMRKMGALKNKIPITFWTMFCAWLAISGIPPFAGFWSKDEILGKAAGYHQIGMALYGVGLLTALMTAFYMTRLMMKTFLTSQRYKESELGTHGGHGGHAHGVHESPPSMWIPLAILALFSVIGGFIGVPWNNQFEKFMEPAIAPYNAAEGMPVPVGMILGTAVGALGIGIGVVLYNRKKETGALLSPEQKQNNPLYQGSLNLWYVDSFFYRTFVTEGGKFANGVWRIVDRGIIDGTVNTVAGLTAFLSEVFRRFQTGYVRSYAFVMLLGVIAVVLSLLWPLLKMMHY
jgi:NADH-quinone oxidoreductase subunit L